MGRFDEANVVVTGGSSAIGAAVVNAFVEEGARVVAVGRDRARLDVLVNNAGIAPATPG